MIHIRHFSFRFWFGVLLGAPVLLPGGAPPLNVVLITADDLGASGAPVLSY